MSLRNGISPSVRLGQPILVEFGLVTVLLTAVYLWRRVVTVVQSALFGAVPAFDELLIGGIVAGGLLVGGVVLLAGAYASVRGLDIGLSLPTRADLPLVGLAGVAPVVLVGLTKLVGTATGVPYNSLTMTAYATDAPLAPVLTVAGLGLFVAVSTLVVVCQVFVQGSFTRVVDDDVAIVLTTPVAGFLVGSSTGGFSATPELGRLVGAGVGVVALGLAVYGTERVDRDRLRYLTYAPAVAVAGLIVGSGIAEVGSVAGGVFAATHLAVLGIAAYAYDRTNSLLVPALAYGCFSASDTLVVYLFEAGMQSW